MMTFYEHTGAACFEPEALRQHLFFGELAEGIDAERGHFVERSVNGESLCLNEWLMIVPLNFLPTAKLAAAEIAKRLPERRQDARLIELFISIFQRFMSLCVEANAVSHFGFDHELALSLLKGSIREFEGPTVGEVDLPFLS
jgi:hypothetical protein